MNPTHYYDKYGSRTPIPGGMKIGPLTFEQPFPMIKHCREERLLQGHIAKEAAIECGKKDKGSNPYYGLPLREAWERGRLE
jgi:hypothetical protein